MNNLLSFASVMSMAGSIIIAFLILLVTITVHEFGHYLIGKLFKFKINEFAIGMGPAIYKKVKANGEIFSIRLFPLGGFCAFEGEDEDDLTVAAENKAQQMRNENQQQNEFQDQNAVQEVKPISQRKLSPDAFNNKPPYQRILVLIAGATVNFIIAVLIVFLNLSIFGSFAVDADEIRMDSAYENYSLQDGDVIRSIDGHFLYLTTDITDALENKKKDDEIIIQVFRDNKIQNVTIKLRNDVGKSVMGEYSDAFSAIGLATETYIQTEEGSPLVSGEKLFKIEDAESYDDCTRIYDLNQFAKLLSTHKEGETVFVWMSESQSNSKQGQRVSILLGEGWSEAVENYNAKTEKGETDAYKSIIKDYLKISAYSTNFKVYSTQVKLSFGELLFRPIVYSFKVINQTFKAIGQIFTGSLPITSLSGPVSTISMTTEYVKTGFDYSFGYGLNFVLEIGAFIGISVAIFNLLPIPALDGARAVFVAIEWVRGKPINRKVEGIIHMVGLFALLLFAILVDVLKLFI